MNLLKSKFAARRTPRFALALLSAAVCCALHAQQAPAPTAPDATAPAKDKKKLEEETIVLSPFIVNAEENQSWQATSSLAGARTRTDLKDLAQPISVFTSEFLKNIGATNFQQAMLYSVNVENENEFAPDDTEGNSVSSTTQNRVRGLAAASQTRGFFKTNFRSDTYNTDRITVASGPNSILFGIGSPAGILDSTPIRANTTTPVGEIGLRTDKYESYRGTIDFGLPIVKDVLAIRVAEMKQKTRTFRTPEYDSERRDFATLTFTPFKSTTIYGSYEHLDDFRIRARQDFMPDHISDWIKLGKPLYDFTTKMWTFDNGATWASRPDLVNWAGSGIGNGERVFMAGGALGGSAVQGLVWPSLGQSFDHTKAPDVTFKDDSIINSKTNYYGLGDQTKLKGQNYSAVVEQKILKDLYAEVAYNKETNVRKQEDPLRGGLSTIQADVNWYLPYPTDVYANPIPGTPVKNPNVGRYFVDSEFLGWKENLNFETERAMLSYNLNFADKGWKWLGRYNFGAMWQRETTDDFTIKTRLTNQGSSVLQSLTNPFGGPNSIVSRYYLSLPGLGGDSAGLQYPGTFIMPPWPTVIGGSGEAPTKSRQIDTGKLFVAQGYLLNDDLVLTYGYRDDTQKAYTASFSKHDPTTNLYQLDIPYDAPITQSGITRTYGAVYHTPLKWLSVLYNRSNAFNPQGQFKDWFYNPLPPGTGKSQDYGVQVDLFDGKFSARISRYTNDSINNVEYDWYYEEPKWGVVGFMDAQGWGAIPLYAPTLAALTHDQSYLKDVNSDNLATFNIGDAIRATRDFKSQGYEMELFYKPTKQLDIRFTLAESTATSLSVVPHLQDYIDSRMAVWQKYFPYKAWGQWDATPTYYSDWKTNPDSIGYQLLNWEGNLPRVAEFKAEKDNVVTRGRKWRANLVSNYRFEGRLKGLSIGGGGRWRSPDTIGYYGKANPLLTDPSVKLQVADISRPIHGKEILVFDSWVAYERPVVIDNHRWIWSAQLNIQNLLNDDKIVPMAAFTDGTYTAYARNEPRNFILSTSLKY